MADGGNNTGKYLAGCGCLTWLGVMLLVVVWQIAWMAIPSVLSSLPGISILGMVVNGSTCCAGIGFLVGLVGIVMMLMGGKKDDI